MISDEPMDDNELDNNKLRLLKSLFIMRDTMNEITRLVKDAADSNFLAYDRLKNSRKELNSEMEKQNASDEPSVNCIMILDLFNKFVALINEDDLMLNHLLTATEQKNLRKPLIKNCEYIELKKDSFVFPSTKDDNFFHVNFKNGWREISLTSLISATGVENDNNLPEAKKYLKKLIEENTWQIRDMLFKEYQILYLKSTLFSPFKSNTIKKHKLELKKMKKYLTESINQSNCYKSIACGSTPDNSGKISDLENKYTDCLNLYESASKHYGSVKKLYNNTCKIITEEFLPMVPPKYVTNCNALTHFILYLYDNQANTIATCISLYEKNKFNNVKEPNHNIDLIRKNVLASIKNSKIYDENTGSVQLYSVLEEIAASKEAIKQIMKKTL